VQDDFAIVRALSMGLAATCMVTVYGKGSTYGQVPVQLMPDVSVRGSGPLAPKIPSLSLSSSTLVLKAGELRAILISSSGAVALTGSCGRVADTELEGHTLHVTARTAGACTVFVRTADGANVPLSIVVPAALERGGHPTVP
jgi:hypothetical protein